MTRQLYRRTKQTMRYIDIFSVLINDEVEGSSTCGTSEWMRVYVVLINIVIMRSFVRSSSPCSARSFVRRRHRRHHHWLRHHHELISISQLEFILSFWIISRIFMCHLRLIFNNVLSSSSLPSSPAAFSLIAIWWCPCRSYTTYRLRVRYARRRHLSIRGRPITNCTCDHPTYSDDQIEEEKGNMTMRREDEDESVT